MRLATRENGTPDGELVLVAADGSRALSARPVAESLLQAIGRWAETAPRLAALAARLDAGEGDPLDAITLRAPLPRSWQWLDGSAFHTHGELMQIAFHLPPIATDRPLMYQGLSDRFYGPGDPVPFPDESDGIDFEGEFGVIVDAVPMGISPAEAIHHIKLIVQINDWSLRTIAPVEMKTGFGWVQAKPPCSMAPFAVTPDELGADWANGRVGLDLHVHRGNTLFGRASGAIMDWGFHELVAHAARTRDLVAGTVIGSGTVSSPDHAQVGSSCISEVRAIEIIRDGAPATPFLRYGEHIRMEARNSGGHAPFGAIDQVVVAPQPHPTQQGQQP